MAQGMGDQMARSRLLLAQRAGYLPPQALPPQRGAATPLWHGASKHLAADARGAGYPNPMQYLRAGLLNQGKLPPPNQRSGAAPLPFNLMQHNSAQAVANTRGNPFGMFAKYQLPRV